MREAGDIVPVAAAACGVFCCVNALYVFAASTVGVVTSLAIAPSLVIVGALGN